MLVQEDYHNNKLEPKAVLILHVQQAAHTPYRKEHHNSVRRGKFHSPITCNHTVNQITYTWMKSGNQPISDKTNNNRHKFKKYFQHNSEILAALRQCICPRSDSNKSNNKPQMGYSITTTKLKSRFLYIRRKTNNYRNISTQAYVFERGPQEITTSLMK